MSRKLAQLGKSDLEQKSRLAKFHPRRVADSFKLLLSNSLSIFSEQYLLFFETKVKTYN